MIEFILNSARSNFTILCSKKDKNIEKSQWEKEFTKGLYFIIKKALNMSIKKLFGVKV